MEILELFKRQLLKDSSTFSKSTLKNYLSDVRHFINWFEKTTNTAFEPSFITSDTILLYEKTLGGLIEDFRLNPSTQLSVASMKRHLSSLRKFFATLEKTGTITQNPFKQIPEEVNEEPTDLWHLRSFKDYLLMQKASKITVKNYLSDISGFAKWYEESILPGMDKPLSASCGFYLITQEILEAYRKKLLEVQNAAPRTINRKLSALRRYLNFATEKGFITTNELTLDPVKVYEERVISQKEPEVELSELPVAIKSQKTYSKIPPVRLAQKLFIYPYLAIEEKIANSIASFIAGKRISGFEKLTPHLASIVNAKNNIRANANSISSLLGVKNVAKEFYAPNKVSLLGMPLYKKLIYHAKYTRPNWYKRYHNYSFVHYVHFALLVIFASGVGVALYQNLVAKKQTPIFAGATAPPRIVSFQGRLTDTLDNPITSTTDMRFAIYNDATASGSALLWQEAITNIAPDQDGIFSVLLGEGTQIPSTVFTDNSQIYLGVTVGTTPELTPRQRIASVGYATNAEFLQGQPPTTQAGITSFANVILALDSSGNLSLADSTPTDHTFQVTNGAFNLKGQTLYLTTNSGSNGNVILSPDGLGKNDIQRPIINSTTMGNLVPGGVEINDKFGVLATESAVAAFIVNNDASGGDIIAASSSGITRFKIENDGTITDSFYNTAGGIIYASNASGTFAQTSAGLLGQCLQSTAGGAPTWGTCGGSDWQINLGTISPNNDTLDLLVGGHTTASAKFRFVNVNTGTPVASISANFGNNATFLTGDGTLGTTNRQTLTIGNSSTYNTTGNILFNPNGIGKIGIGTTNPLVGFDLRGNSGTAPAASISANTSHATLLVDNSGVGDLIVASASGVPNFIVKNNGDLIVGQDGNGKLTVSVIDPYLIQNQKTSGIQSLTFQTMGATNADFIFKNVDTTLLTMTMAGQMQLPITGSTGGIVIGGDTQLFRGSSDRLDLANGDSFNLVNGNLQIGGITIIDSSRNGNFQTLTVTGGCTGCTSGPTSPFQQLTGSIVPLNSTLDLLIGAQATTSAKFAVLNMASGTPIASVSATSTGKGISLSGDGTIQALRNNTLTIGGNTTGDIAFRPGNAATPTLYLKTGGNIGIGTTNPTTKLSFASSTSPNDGISFGTDTNIYRSSTSTLATTNNLLVGSATTEIDTKGNIATSSAVDNSNPLHWGAIFSHMKMGNDGYYRIVYVDDNNLELHFVRCVNIDCTTKNNNIIDNSHIHYPFLAIGNDGFGRIIYSDTNFGTLEFKRCTNADCTTGTKTTLNASGADLSVPFQIGSDGFPRIVFTDNITGDLTYLQCTNADCTATSSAVLDTNYPSLYAPFVLASDTFARMVYTNNTYDLVFVQCTNADCSSKTTTTITSGNSDYAYDLKLGTDGFARFIYQDGNNGDFVFVQCTNASCSTRNTTTIETGVNSYSGVFKFGSDGFPRILFRNSDDLTFVQCTNASCSTRNTTQLNATTTNSYSMTLDSNGFANIVFNDSATYDVMAIRCENASCSNNTKVYIHQGPYYDDSINIWSDLQVNGDGALRFSYADTDYYLQIGVVSQKNYSTNGYDLYVAGDIGINRDIFSDGSLFLAGDGQIAGNTLIGGDLRVSGKATMLDTFEVLGNATFNSNVSVNGSFDASSISTGNLSASNTTLNGELIQNSSSSNFYYSSYNTSGNANDVYVAGKFAYVADGTSGLEVFDISIDNNNYPPAPSLLGTFDTSGDANGVVVNGRYAYIADGTSGLAIIDVSNPSSPTLVGTYDTTGTAYNVYVSGRYAYVADGTSGLAIIDVSNPSSPTLVGTYDTTGTAYNVYVSGRYAYVADGTSGLAIIDVSNPNNPTLTGSYSSISNARSVDISGNYAYIADSSSVYGLKIINISNPASPSLTSSNYLGIYPVDIQVAGKYAYLAYPGYGLWVVDISNLPFTSGYGLYISGISANGIFISGRYIYLAAGSAGLYTGKLTGITSPAIYAGNIATNDLTVTENSSIGNNLYIGNGLNVGVGGILSQGQLSVNSALSGNLIQGAPVGKALLTLNYTGSGQNIFTASSSGVTKFAIGNDGQVLFGNAASDPSTALGAGSVYYNTTTQSLKFYNGTTWSTIGSGGSSPFKEELGSIIANQPTEDFILGGNATSSAKFAVLNLNLGTPIASVSATSTGKGISLSGDGTIQALRNNTLTIGGNTTGDIAFRPGNIMEGYGLYLSSNGNVGIGTSDAPVNSNLLLGDSKLAVYSTSGNGPTASISAKLSSAPTLLVTNEGAGDLIVASVSGQPKFRVDNTGSLHIGSNIFNDYGADMAEYYKKANPNEQFIAGELACMTSSGVVKCSNNNPNQKIIGVVSDNPMIIGYAKYSKNPSYVLVGMLGQLGVWVNGDVKAGDPLTFSSTPGVATVAKGAGNIIGYAQEGNNNTLKRVESVIQPTYFNPNTALQNENVFNSLTLGIQNGIYTVFDAFGNSITHIDAFSKAIIGSLQAGFASIETLTANTFTAAVSSLGNATASTFAVAANTITIGGKDIKQFIIDTVTNAGFNQEVVSPIATGTVKTNIISPLAENSSVQLNINQDNFELKNTDTGKTVAWFNKEGNATISGQLISEGIQTSNATVSGTLSSGLIQTTDASVAGTLRAENIIANNITGLDDKLATLAAAITTPQVASVSTTSGQIVNLNEGTLAFNTINANFGIFEQGITSMGPVTANILTATDTLSVGNSFTITNNAINTVGTDLAFQSLRQGDISFEGGLIKMDTDGNMLISGNLNLLGEIDAVYGVFSGSLTTKALATGLISPLPGDDLAIKLSDTASNSGKLKIVNNQNQEVLSINSRGDINASGSATLAKLNFNLVGKADATSLTEAIATGSAGFATLRQGQVELTIKNPIITSKSLIYITPFGDTSNKVIYLLRQVPQSETEDGSFTVGISGSPAPSDIQFNWLIVN